MGEITSEGVSSWFLLAKRNYINSLLPQNDSRLPQDSSQPGKTQLQGLTSQQHLLLLAFRVPCIVPAMRGAADQGAVPGEARGAAPGNALEASDEPAAASARAAGTALCASEPVAVQALAWAGWDSCSGASLAEVTAGEGMSGCALSWLLTGAGVCNEGSADPARELGHQGPVTQLLRLLSGLRLNQYGSPCLCVTLVRDRCKGRSEAQRRWRLKRPDGFPGGGRRRHWLNF
ncbi:MAG: hypothetical protein FRX49_08447 [Trebouxia sp. A1-2]|nr:MAG: hypothetical protein FRX49_08447 [Trebouxia sp. A1-2]